MLRDFFYSTMTSSRTALVGIGVDTMHLTRMADALHLTNEKGPADGKVRTTPCSSLRAKSQDERTIILLGPKLMFAEHSLAGPKQVWAD